MAVITRNERISPDIYQMELTHVAQGAPGQFVLVYLDDESRLLPRPISLFDARENRTTLVYRTVGAGTARMAALRAGDTLRVSDPRGNGFPLCSGDAVLVGGGLGIAPLYYLARALKRDNAARHVRVYLGYSGAPFLSEAFAPYADELIVRSGGLITDEMRTDGAAAAYACGPEPMMRAAAARAGGVPVYVSLERRMACGEGACYGCTVRTALGNRRVCHDGPVFPASEVWI